MKEGLVEEISCMDEHTLMNHKSVAGIDKPLPVISLSYGK